MCKVFCVYGPDGPDEVRAKTHPVEYGVQKVPVNLVKRLLLIDAQDEAFDTSCLAVIYYVPHEVQVVEYCPARNTGLLGR